MIAAALKFPFRGPNVWVNIGCLVVCFLIPIVGPIVMIGYLVGMERHLIENKDADAPKFDFGKFSFYLKRGVYPFLVSLVVMMVCMIPLMIFMWGTFFGGILLMEKHPVAGVGLFICGGLGYLLFVSIMGVLITPLVLKAGLEESFKAGFDFRFMLDYLRRVGLLAAGLNLLLFLMMIPVMPFAMCFPLSYALMTIIVQVQAHLRIQLYMEYLKRGGTVIEFAPEVPEGAFPVVQNPPPYPPMPR